MNEAFAWQRGAPASVLGRMVVNVAVDTAVGAIPLLGDLFDVVWKANDRNVRLLDEFMQRPTKATRASRLVLAAVITALALLIVGSVALAIAIARAIFSAIAGA